MRFSNAHAGHTVCAVRPPARGLLSESRQTLLEVMDEHGAEAFIGDPIEGDPDLGVDTCAMASGVAGGSSCKELLTCTRRCSRCELMRCARVGLYDKVVILPCVPIFPVGSMANVRSLVDVLVAAEAFELSEDGSELVMSELARFTAKVERQMTRS